MRFVPALVLALTVASGFAHASRTKFVEPGGETSFTISDSEVNRIAVVGDRITSFIKIQGTFSQGNDPESGDIFITPLNQGYSQSTISGFVTTEQGNTFQLRLILKNQPSTNTELKLRTFGQDAQKARSWERQFDTHQLAALNLARAIESGESLPGYETEYYDKGLPLKAASLGVLTARINGLALGYDFMAEQITIHNPTQQAQALSERRLNDQRVYGVWLLGAASLPQTDDDEFMLAPDQSIKAIRIRQNIIQ
jgi:hypothetical protein